MDHDDSTTFLGRIGASNSLTRSMTPVLGLTRRGDLKTKLQALARRAQFVMAHATRGRMLPTQIDELRVRSSSPPRPSAVVRTSPTVSCLIHWASAIGSQTRGGTL